MSYFYGRIHGSRGGVSTRAGDKISGLTTEAASWAGSITVDLRHDKDSGKDCFRVTIGKWNGVGPEPFVLAEGEFPE